MQRDERASEASPYLHRCFTHQLERPIQFMIKRDDTQRRGIASTLGEDSGLQRQRDLLPEGRRAIIAGVRPHAVARGGDDPRQGERELDRLHRDSDINDRI